LLDIYPARELPMEGITSTLIFDLLSCKEKLMISKEELIETIRLKTDIDVLLTIGAGDIDKYVNEIKNILMETSSNTQAGS